MTKVGILEDTQGDVKKIKGSAAHSEEVNSNSASTTMTRLAWTVRCSSREV